jgi:hypothetical protein
MTSFAEVRFPPEISYGATAGPEFSTTVITVRSGELAVHLGGEVTTLATCIRVIRCDGTVFAFTSGTADLSIDGIRYKAKGGFPPLQHPRL